jgi:Family of unknown function (DUF5995)
MPRNLRWAVGLVCVLGLLAPSAASADLITTTLTDWSTVLPGLTNSFDANDPNICNAGKNSCVAAVLKEMDKRLAPLEATCSHNAMFSLLYDHITRQYYNTVVANPTFFNSNDFVNHEDAVFASYYFGAYDNYASGNLAAVPQAWQIAFSAAATHQVTGTGNILLGVNAHIRRDLPFVLYRIGLTEPDGSNLKPDHDKVNQILDAAFADAIKDASAHLDPSVNPNFPPALASWGFTTEFQAVEAWREEAYRNAEALASAPDDAARALISQQIEANAAASATAIRDSSLYAPTGTSATRDAYCAANQPVG